MIEQFLENVLLGITGGIISSLVVSRIFMIDSEYKEEIKIIERFFLKTSYFSGCVDFSARLLEEICDRGKNSSREDCQEIEAWERLGGFLDNEGLMLLKSKAEILETEMFGVYVHDKQLSIIRNDLESLSSKILKMEQCTFSDLRECQEMIRNLRKKYGICIKNKRKTLIKKIIFDKVMLVLFVIIILLVIAMIVSVILGV